MSAPDVAKRLRAIQERGGRVVVIDPRRTETAARADEHHVIRPGTDVFLLLALVQVLYAENLVNPGRLADFHGWHCRAGRGRGRVHARSGCRR